MKSALTVALVCVGCEGAGRDLGDEPGDENDGAALFDPTHVVEVRIELPSAEWDRIRTQNRTILDIFRPGCLDEPFESPFTYASATVTVDGSTLSNVGVRKKGFFGSLDDDRPSLKLKFDKYVAGRELDGLERMTLNNNRQDPSLVHQCVGYQVFEDTGVPAPRCNFAHVTVNGVDLGVYSHVEGVKKRFLRRHFSDDEGQLYEGTLSDFQHGWTATFEQKTNDERPYDRSDLAAVVAALERPDDELLSALDPLVDVDAFMTFWATEVLVGHWDGYASNTNNYFAYHDPASDKFHFIPWGIDDILSDGEDAPESRSVFATGELARRLYQSPDGRALYEERMRELLAQSWDENVIRAEVDRIESLIDPYVGTDNDVDVARVRTFVAEQRDRITAELDASLPSWEEGPREEICFEELGTLDASFDTTWGTLEMEEDPFAAGTGTLDMVLDGMMSTPVLVGSAAGLPPDEPSADAAVVQVVALLPDDTAVIVYVELAPDLFVGGASIEIDWSDAFVTVVGFDLATEQDYVIGALGGGTVAIEAAGLSDGAEVRGTISGPLVDFPF